MTQSEKIQAENERLKAMLSEISEQLIEMQIYYNSSKFHGVENDYAHVKTDVYPKVSGLKFKVDSFICSI